MNIKDKILNDKDWSLGIFSLAVLFTSMIYLEARGNSLDTTEWFIICAINGILMMVSMVYSIIQSGKDIANGKIFK